MRPVKATLLAGLAIVLAGCSQGVSYRPLENGTKVGMFGAARYTVPTDSSHTAVITLIGSGVDRSASGGNSDAVAIRATVDNPSSVPVAVTSANLVLPFSNSSRAMANVLGADNSPVYGYVGSAMPPTTAPGAIGHRTEFIFHLPQYTNLSSLDSFRLVWTANVSGRAQSFTTDFVKQSSAPWSDESPSPYGNTLRSEYWMNADTGAAKNTGVWYGIIGAPFDDNR